MVDLDRGDVPIRSLPVLLATGEVKDYPIFDSREPKIDTVYVIKEYPNGSRLVFNKAYSMVGRLTITDEAFVQLMALTIQTDPRYMGGDDHMPGVAYWLDLDDEARARQTLWARQKYREDHPES